ncbi:MAG TPA: alpha/beta fold hydrolase [Verrucomicrobiae bacterium]|nr:alpha/beta fold hydrolase [Verrucomicrobiae bacterium]
MTTFEPTWPLRHAHVQSALASLKVRNWPRRGHALIRLAERHVLDCGDGIRLVGLHTKQPANSKGLVVLIHGWEGSHESAYLLSFAITLFEAGYNVFRLNLRDHGGTHDLNEDLFHSARIGEVLGALRAIRKIDGSRPFFVVGFSLGGNFALRLGLRGHEHEVAPDLSVGICPAINPGATLRALDTGPALFHRYFISKWRATLMAKAEAWPGKYDFADVMGMTNFTDITARFVEQYTEYGQLDKYLAAYTLTPEILKASKSPLAIVTSQDDPVVPFADFDGIVDAPGLRLLAPKHGGHCGFVENFRLRSWAEQRVLEMFRDHERR